MFTYHIPTKIYFGKGQLENLGNGELNLPLPGDTAQVAVQ